MLDVLSTNYTNSKTRMGFYISSIEPNKKNINLSVNSIYNKQTFSSYALKFIKQPIRNLIINNDIIKLDYYDYFKKN